MCEAMQREQLWKILFHHPDMEICADEMRKQSKLRQLMIMMQSDMVFKKKPKYRV